MELIAKVTLVTPGGSVAPGGEVEVKDDAEAASLVERGFAEEIAPAPKGKAPRGTEKSDK